MACLPIPPHFFANIDSIAVIATDSEGSTQTVLNSGTRVEGAGLKVCGFVGTVPTVLAVGLEGAPGPLPPTPEVVVKIVELPVTGGSAPTRNLAALLLILGLVIVSYRCALRLVVTARNAVALRAAPSSSSGNCFKHLAEDVAEIFDVVGRFDYLSTEGTHIVLDQLDLVVQFARLDC